MHDFKVGQYYVYDTWGDNVTTATCIYKVNKIINAKKFEVEIIYSDVTEKYIWTMRDCIKDRLMTAAEVILYG